MLHGRTLWELMEKRVDATPDSLMAVDEDMRTVTFAEFWHDAELAAAGLLACGINVGDVVSWQLPSSIETMVLTAALNRIGAIQNPVLPIYRDHELSLITTQADTKVLVVPSVWAGFDYEEMALDIAREHRDMRVLVVNRAVPQGDVSTLGAVPGAESEEPEIRWLFYSSGITSVPKGALHTDATIAAAAKGMAQRLGLIPRDRNALVCPLAQIGAIVWLFASLQSGCANILTESFSASETPDVLGREGVTLAGSGTGYHRVYVSEQRKSLHPLFPDVRAFVGNGDGKTPSLVEDVRNLFGVPVLSGYGLAEAPVLTMADLSDSYFELAHTTGKPLNGVEVRVIDHQGHVVTGSGQGELRVRAPQMMRGYVDSSLDKAAFDEDGFFRTGDVGQIDAQGNVEILGRVKDIIISNGENVSATEVECLLQGLDNVEDVAVIGLPDADSGERVCAVIQVAEGSDTVSFDEVIVYLREHGLTIRKLPDQVEIVDLIPRNQLGQVLKYILQDEFKGSTRLN